MHHGHWVTCATRDRDQLLGPVGQGAILKDRLAELLERLVRGWVLTSAASEAVFERPV